MSNLQVAYVDLLSRMCDGTEKENTEGAEPYKLTFNNGKNMRLADQLLEQWKTGSFCDVKFRVGDDTMLAHRCVLAASCNYFDTMFSANFVEKSMPEVDLSISFNSADTLKLIIGSVYGCSVEIVEENVQELIHGADLFGLTDLMEHCVFFLLTNLQLQNCLWTLTVADMYSLQEVVLVCQDLAVCRFSDTLIHLEETQTLPPAHLVKFLQKGMAKFCEPTELEHFLHQYISEDQSERSGYKQALLDAAAAGKQCALPCQKLEKPKEDDSKLQEEKETVIIDEKPLPTAKNVKSHVEHLTEKAAENELSGARPKVKGFSIANEEVVLMAMPEIKGSKWCIYSVSKDQWLTLSNTYSAIPPEWKMKMLGVGPKQDYALFDCIVGQKYKLLNITDFKTIDVPEVPNVGPAADAVSSRKEQTIVVASGEELFSVLLNRRMVQKKQNTNRKKGNIQPWEENLHTLDMLTKTHISYGVFIQRYDFIKGEWCYISKVVQSKEPITRVHCMQQQNGDSYIIMFKKDCILLVTYSPFSRFFKRLRPYQGEVPHLSWHRFGDMATTLFGYSDKLVINHENNSIIYNIGSNTWTRKQDTPLLPSLTELGFSNSAKQQVFCQSHHKGKLYLVAENIVGRSYFLWYSPLDKVYKHLAPIPAMPSSPYAYNQGSCLIVPHSILSKLSPVTMTDQIQDRVLSPTDAWITMRKYKKRTGTDTESLQNNCNCTGCTFHREEASVYDEYEDDEDDNDYPENFFEFMYDSDEKYMFGYGSYDNDYDDYFGDDDDGDFEDF